MQQRTKKTELWLKIWWLVVFASLQIRSWRRDPTSAIRFPEWNCTRAGKLMQNVHREISLCPTVIDQDLRKWIDHDEYVRTAKKAGKWMHIEFTWYNDTSEETENCSTSMQIRSEDIKQFDNQTHVARWNCMEKEEMCCASGCCDASETMGKVQHNVNEIILWIIHYVVMIIIGIILFGYWFYVEILMSKRIPTENDESKENEAERNSDDDDDDEDYSVNDEEESDLSTSEESGEDDGDVTEYEVMHPAKLAEYKEKWLTNPSSEGFMMSMECSEDEHVRMDNTPSSDESEVESETEDNDEDEGEEEEMELIDRKESDSEDEIGSAMHSSVPYDDDYDDDGNLSSTSSFDVIDRVPDSP